MPASGERHDARAHISPTAIFALHCALKQHTISFIGGGAGTPSSPPLLRDGAPPDGAVPCLYHRKDDAENYYGFNSMMGIGGADWALLIITRWRDRISSARGGLIMRAHDAAFHGRTYRLLE